MQNRFKSKYLWLAIFALVSFILKNWGLFEVVGLNADSFNELTDLVLALLVALGIVNNPTDKEKW